MKVVDINKNLLAVGTAFALALIPMSAKAEWISVAESADAFFYVGNPITVVVATDEPSFFWARMVYKRRQPDGVKASVSHNAVNCDMRAVQIKKIVHYNSQGRVIKTEDLSDNSEWQIAIPGSTLESTLDTVCS